MISPAIKPRVAFKPISRGLIVAARNSVNKVQESTQTISKRLNKNEKFAMNYVEFFGSKKTTKILKKNLKSIKESLMSTFEMAKILKKRVGEMSKGGGIGAAGGALGGVAGVLGKGLLGGLFGKLVIGSLVGLAVGGIGYLLAKNPEKFFEFLKKQEEQFSRIVMGIVKKSVPQLFAPSGLDELTTEFDTNLESQALALMKEDPSLSKDQAITNATLKLMDEVSKQIINLRAERDGLDVRKDRIERRQVASQILKLESFLKYMRQGDQYYADPAGGILANNIFGSGVDVPLRFESMIPEKRLTTVKNFVDTSGMSLDMLEFQILQSANQPSNRGEARFYEDTLNYIDAKRKKDKGKNFGVNDILSENFKKDEVIKGIRDEYETRFSKILNYDSRKRDLSKNNVNINVEGGGNGGVKNNTNNETLISSKPDSGIIDIKFYSPLDSDLAMERGTAKSLYGVYMG